MLQSDHVTYPLPRLTKGMGLSFLDEEIHNEIFWLVLTAEYAAEAERAQAEAEAIRQRPYV